MSAEHVAIVTGGAQGIGFGIASRLAHDGMRVAIIDLDGDRAEQAAEQLGVDGLGLGGDVSNPDEMESAVDVVRQKLGGPTVLVSNAGWSPYKDFLELTHAEIERVVAVNYTGPLALCRAMLPEMLERGHGRIVFIGSDAGRVGTRNESVYAGTKAALLGFAKSLAVEVAGGGVTVNVVSPGSTDTALLRGMVDEDGLQKRLRANPMKRLGTAQDIADTVAFFCGSGASYITGQVLSVNGGMSRLG